jgi:hypothetical protein
MIEAGRQAVLEENPGRVKSFFFACYLAFVAVFSIALGVRMTRQVSPFIIGEWLINYSGGFIRRGLIGSVVLFVGHITGIALPWIVFPIQVVTFLLFIGCVYWLTKGLRWNPWMAAVLLSPATLAFTVMDSYAGFRKEFLLFAALALVICVVMSGRLRDWQLSALLSVVSVGLMLSHEALVVGFPYFFAAVAIQKGSAAKAAKVFYVPALLAAIALVAVMLHPANLAITQAVCTSVGGTLGPFNDPSGNVCSGSIEWLQFTLPQARALFVPAIREYHLVRLFSLLAIPTFTPMIVLLVQFYRRDRLHHEVKMVIVCGALSLVGTAILFYIALDWGRWVHIQAICLMLMVLMLDHRAEPVVVVRRSAWLRYTGVALLAVYATTWTLPSIGRDDARHGYLDVIHMLRSYRNFK